ncbi:MAG: type II toxin-antitoxin system HicB family antitoxin [Bacteroidales bacterium]|nr:type II toxin-antitoxin system HicB family antitoxin [Bacteroidales bacterium]MCF8454494.1 type II toxin-antitoxin system HicB family antitoxin [Bacteroidales bacterium]
MKTIRIVIEKSSDHYSAYADNVEGIFGAGDTVAECKQSVLDAIDLMKEYNEKIPQVLQEEYQLTYHFDSVSFLNYYKGILSNSALERLTGINQKQMQHYASGLRKPREAQRQKITNALHKLGEELLAAEL